MVLIVVPNAYENTEADNSNVYPFDVGGLGGTSMRYQQIYDHSQFSIAGTITAIAFRRDTTASTFGATTYDLKINLAYSANTPPNIDAVFANNVGSNNTTCIDNSNVSLSSSGSGSPNPFDFIISFTTGFFYNPNLGDLLVDIFVRNTVNQAGAVMDFQSNAANLVSRMDNSPYTASSGSGDSQPSGLITQFNITPFNAVSIIRPLQVYSKPIGIIPLAPNFTNFGTFVN